MAIDLQKLEQKFNALLDDPNFVTDFEKWLEARNVSQNSNNAIVMRSAFVVYNINGDVIGVASTYEKAEKIFAERYGDFDPSIAITEFEVDRLYYA